MTFAMLCIVLLSCGGMGVVWFLRFNEGWKEAWVVRHPDTLPHHKDLLVLAVFKLAGKDVAALHEVIAERNWNLDLTDAPLDQWPKVGQVIQAYETTKGIYTFSLCHHECHESFDQLGVNEEARL